jgi:hypothetical protein
LKEFNNINVEDDSLVVMNSYRVRKANVKLLRAVKTYMEQCEVIDKTNPEVKLALDSLAVLDTYTGCRAVTNKLICSLGNNSIKLDNFNTEFGVDNTKNIAIQLKKPQGKVQGGVLDNNAKNTKQGLAAGK